MAYSRPYVRKHKSGSARIVRDGYSNATVDWWTIRKQVFARDGGVCRCSVGGRRCGKPGQDVHHIIPLGRGGTTTMANLITVCRDCHDARHRNSRRTR